MKKAVLTAIPGILCLCLFASCDGMIPQEVTEAQTKEHIAEYRQELADVSHKYGYTFQEKEATEREYDSGRVIAKYQIEIDETSQVTVRITNKEGEESFSLVYTDQQKTPVSVMRSGNTTLIRSLLEMANCLSGKEYPYEKTRDFLGDSSKGARKTREGELISRRGCLDPGGNWTIDYTLDDTLKEQVAMNGPTRYGA